MYNNFNNRFNNNSNNTLNQLLDNLTNLSQQGLNPEQIKQQLIQQNPQLQQAMVLYQNMSNGRNEKEFLNQLVGQVGLDQNTLEKINKLTNRK